MTRNSSACVLGVLIAATVAIAGLPARAADGQVLITHSKALAGNVTTGDLAGYPVTLSKAGSYILGSDLSPGPNLDGIVAATSDISIDLNGFRIVGGPAGGSNNARYGIWDKGDRLTVKNGTITGFNTAAIYAPNRQYLVVESMRLINSYRGLNNQFGFFGRIQNNTVASNASIGILCDLLCLVEGNVVASNGDYGVYIRSGTVLGNTIGSNTSYGIYVFDRGCVGYGYNTLFQNNSGGAQVSGNLLQLHANASVPSCTP